MPVHSIPPIYDTRSVILILGSFPSVRSREVGFFYGHPQNRFWRVISAILGQQAPTSIEEKRALLLRHHIALWDVAESCEIQGSADSSLKQVVPNDLSIILASAPVRHIFVNGQAAARLYHRLIEPITNIPATTLPSTSPANTSWSLDRLIEAWQVIANIEKDLEM